MHRSKGGTCSCLGAAAFVETSSQPPSASSAVPRQRIHKCRGHDTVIVQLCRKIAALCLSLYLDFDGDLQSCHNSPVHKEHQVWWQTTCTAKHTVTQCSTLIVFIFDSLTSPRQLCSASHQSVQDSPGPVDSFSPISLASTFRLFALSGSVLLTSVTLVSFAFFLFNQQLSVSLARFLFTSVLGDVHPSGDVKCCCSARFSWSHSSRSLQHRSIVQIFVCFDTAVFLASCPDNYSVPCNIT